MLRRLSLRDFVIVAELEVEFAQNRIYRPDGRDLHVTLPVTPWEAALGATVKAPTPGGVVEVGIPPGTQPGRKLRLKGRGIPGEPAGDGTDRDGCGPEPSHGGAFHGSNGASLTGLA